jgi:hypothetical protein
MTELEERLRAAVRAAGDTVTDDSAPPLALRSGPARHLSPGRPRPRGRKMLVSLVAAAAVLAVTATAVAIASHSPHPPRPTSIPGSFQVRGVPRYYLELPLKTPTSSGQDGLVAARDAAVVATRTGRRLAVARPPAPYATFTAATGAADDRTFVLAAQLGLTGSGPGDDIAKLYLARFNPSQGALSLQPLAIPAFSSHVLLDDFALSPSGTELAVAVRTGRNASVLQIRLYSLTGRLLKSWQGAGSFVGPFLSNEAMSWSATGTLAITWIPHATQGVYLLSTQTAGGSLAADARLVVPAHPKGDAFEVFGTAVLSGDGQRLVVPMVQLRAVPPAIAAEFQEFSAVTGQQIRTLLPVRATDIGSAIWSNWSGSTLVVETMITKPKSAAGWTIGVVRHTKRSSRPTSQRPEVNHEVRLRRAQRRPLHAAPARPKCPPGLQRPRLLTGRAGQADGHETLQE